MLVSSVFFSKIIFMNFKDDLTERKKERVIHFLSDSFPSLRSPPSYMYTTYLFLFLPFILLIHPSSPLSTDPSVEVRATNSAKRNLPKRWPSHHKTQFVTWRSSPFAHIFVVQPSNMNTNRKQQPLTIPVIAVLLVLMLRCSNKRI